MFESAFQDIRLNVLHFQKKQKDNWLPQRLRSISLLILKILDFKVNFTYLLQENKQHKRHYLCSPLLVWLL